MLPEGVHEAKIEEFESIFAQNQHRQLLFQGLKQVIEIFKKAGCKTIYIDGSFVTEKETPGDFDICWDEDGVDIDKLDPVLIDFNDKRKAQKLKFKGECFPLSWDSGAGKSFIDFFQIDRFTGKKKGIIKLEL